MLNEPVQPEAHLDPRDPYAREAQTFRRLSEERPRGLWLTARRSELGVDPDRIGEWMRRQQERALSGMQAVAA
jgi:hypothetical protein